MARLAKCLRVILNPTGTRNIFVDNDEFPWYTSGGIEKVEDYPGAEGVYLATVRLVIDGPVVLDEDPDPTRSG